MGKHNMSIEKFDNLHSLFIVLIRKSNQFMSSNEKDHMEEVIVTIKAMG